MAAEAVAHRTSGSLHVQEGGRWTRVGSTAAPASGAPAASAWSEVTIYLGSPPRLEVRSKSSTEAGAGRRPAAETGEVLLSCALSPIHKWTQVDGSDFAHFRVRESATSKPIRYGLYFVSAMAATRCTLAVRSVAGPGNASSRPSISGPSPGKATTAAAAAAARRRRSQVDAPVEHGGGLSHSHSLHGRRAGIAVSHAHKHRAAFASEKAQEASARGYDAVLAQVHGHGPAVAGLHKGPAPVGAGAALVATPQPPLPRRVPTVPVVAAAPTDAATAAAAASSRSRRSTVAGVVATGATRSAVGKAPVGRHRASAPPTPPKRTVPARRRTAPAIAGIGGGAQGSAGHTPAMLTHSVLPAHTAGHVPAPRAADPVQSARRMLSNTRYATAGLIAAGPGATAHRGDTGSAGAGLVGGDAGISVPEGMQRQESVTYDVKTAQYVNLPEQWRGKPLQFATRLQGCPKRDVAGYGKLPAVLVMLSELFRRVDGREAHGVFRIAPDREVVSRAAEAIERGEFRGTDDPHVAALLLKRWFRGLEPVRTLCTHCKWLNY